MTSKSPNPNRLTHPRKFSGARNIEADDGRPVRTDAHDSSMPAGVKTPGSEDRSKRRESRPKRHPHPEADYEVGYSRPPKHTRFQPGKSGNPNGRVPQSRNPKTIVTKVLGEQVRIPEGGRLRSMTRFEAAVRVVMSRVFKGDPKAMASLLVLLKQSGYGHEQTENSPELLQGVDHEAVLEEFLARAALEDPTEAEQPSDDPTEEPDLLKKGKA